MLRDVVPLLLQLCITLLAFSAVLGYFLLPVLDGALHALYLSQPPLNLLAESGVPLQEGLVLGRVALRGCLILLQLLFAPGSCVLNHLLQIRLHLVILLDILVLDELKLRLMVRDVCLLAVLLVALDLLDDERKLTLLESMLLLDVLALDAELLHESGYVSAEFIVQRKQPALLDLKQAVHVQQVAPHSHLVLLLRFIKVSVQHLKDRILSVDVSLVILRDDFHLLLQLLGLRRTHDLEPAFLNPAHVVLCIPHLELGVPLESVPLLH
mmetsp:Transcript_19219/g.30694  ORF Transcript_19219/g.30694 Transcript_19219/m.30694 type:complete len:268 (-) Transcript_19219:150-953(-)